MATNTAAVLPPARQDPRQVLNTLKKTVNWNDAGVSTGISFANSIPQGAFITDVHVYIATAFNAGATNQIFVGTNASSYNNIVNGSVDVNATIVQDNVVTRAWGPARAASADVTPFVMFTQTGAAATAGQAVVIICYDSGFSS